MNELKNNKEKKSKVGDRERRERQKESVDKPLHPAFTPNPVPFLFGVCYCVSVCAFLFHNYCVWSICSEICCSRNILSLHTNDFYRSYVVIDAGSDAVSTFCLA